MAVFVDLARRRHDRRRTVPSRHGESSTSSILAPTATPARIRAARSLAPCASMTRGIGFEGLGLYPPRASDAAGDATGSAKSRRAGGSLRTRRLRIDPSASNGGGATETTSPDDHERDEPRAGSSARVLLARARAPRSGSRSCSRSVATSSTSMPHDSTSRSPSSSVGRSSFATRGRPSSACSGSERPISRRARPSSASSSAGSPSGRPALSEAEVDVRTASSGSRCGRVEARSLERRERAARGTRGAESRSSRPSSRSARRDGLTGERRAAARRARVRARRALPARRDRSRLSSRWGSPSTSRTPSSSSPASRRSPLPGDTRRCAYLVRGTRGEPESGGNS